MQTTTIRFALLLFCIFMAAHIAAAERPDTNTLDAKAKRYTVTTEKAFSDVVEDIEFAISQHNYRITSKNHIGSAIAHRTEKPYPQSTIIHFCSIQAAKKIYEINPEYLLHMPCRISARETAKGTTIDARLIPENDPAMHALALKVNQMMRAIADYAAE